MHPVGKTAKAEGGEVESGVVPNRSYDNAPDIEQQKRLQARQETDWAQGRRDDHPPFTRVGPDRAQEESSDESVEESPVDESTEPEPVQEDVDTTGDVEEPTS